MSNSRLTTGNHTLDELLGGGLLPGTLTVVVGATGIGKTQLGVQFAAAGQSAEGRRGIIFDMSCRGDGQNHRNYAARLAGWQLAAADAQHAPDPHRVFAGDGPIDDYLHVFDYHGKRVTRGDLDFEAWQDWQAEIARKLEVAVGFFYGNFVRGCRRVVIDGIEPVERPRDSIQFELIEYVYHQVLRKDPEWVARDLLRQRFREFAAEAAAARYEPEEVGCVLLYTSPHALLDDLIDRPLDEGDALSNANTVILMGRERHGDRLGRALYIAKHRGSAASDRIVPFEITDAGISLAESSPR